MGVLQLKYCVSWLAASIFFAVGSLVSAIPACLRSILYAGRISTGSWSMPDATLEQLVPTWLSGVGRIAYCLCVAALVVPFVLEFSPSARRSQET